MLPRDWTRYVNRAETEAELTALRVSVRRARPFGDTAWQTKIARQLDLQHTFRNVSMTLRHWLGEFSVARVVDFLEIGKVRQEG